jgi:hypothetical protein
VRLRQHDVVLRLLKALNKQRLIQTSYLTKCNGLIVDRNYRRSVNTVTYAVTMVLLITERPSRSLNLCSPNSGFLTYMVHRMRTDNTRNMGHDVLALVRSCWGRNFRQGGRAPGPPAGTSTGKWSFSSTSSNLRGSKPCEIDFFGWDFLQVLHNTFQRVTSSEFTDESMNSKVHSKCITKILRFWGK